MSTTLGIDISTRAIDLVQLDESTNRAEWKHINLAGETAFDRLRSVRMLMPRAEWYEDVYLVAIEEPMGRNQPGTSAKLNRVVGAVAASVPSSIQTWLVTPVQWRKELGLPGNASKEECAEQVLHLVGPPHYERMAMWDWPQDALDAYAIAYYARNVNARALV